MSVGYKAITWSPHKRLYDGAVAAAVLVYIAVFVIVSKVLWPGADGASDEVLLLRATGSCALVLLHIILCIGPLSRLEPRFLAVLGNRRHLGVLTFLIALLHASVAIGYYHGFGVVNPLVSLLTSNVNFGSLSSFPYQLLGVAALMILFLLAATSHDFWLKNLSASTWKRLHMLVYVAYVLLIGHVAFGALQTGRGLFAVLLVGVGVLVVAALHIGAGLREARTDRGVSAADGDWIDVGTPSDIPMDRARMVCAAATGHGDRERIAVFRHAGGISAVTNVCAHQGGPLGEGKVIDGCITCPWHGWQYKPEDGRSPPPFEETIVTYPVRIVAGRVQVSTRALPPGQRTTPAGQPGSVEGPRHG